MSSDPGDVGTSPEDLRLADHPGDEPVWTAGALDEAESAVIAESAYSEEAPRLEGLDLSDSPGDEPLIRPPVGGSTGHGSNALVVSPDTGRDADSPGEIPARGWIEVAKRVKEEVRRDNLTLVSAGIAFYALLSLAPALAATVSIYGLASDPEDVTQQLAELSSTMPAEARQLLEEQLSAVAGSSSTGLGLGAVLGILVAFWGASAAMNQLLVALSVVYDEEETRGPVKLRGMALGLTIVGIGFLLAVVGLIAVVPAILADSPLGDGAATAVSVARWPVLLVLMLAALAVLYKIGPDRDSPEIRWVSWGAGIATGLWLLASGGFSFYVTHFGSYNETYGTMGAVIVLMLWLLITSLCILLGAEINAELEHQTAKNSTQGPTRPLGSRDAHVADTGAPSTTTT